MDEEEAELFRLQSERNRLREQVARRRGGMGRGPSDILLPDNMTMGMNGQGLPGTLRGLPGSEHRVSSQPGHHQGPGGSSNPFSGPDSKACPQDVTNGNPTAVDDGEDVDLASLLSKKSYKEMQQSQRGEELLQLLQKPTAKESKVAAKFKTKGGSSVREFCPNLTKEDCRRQIGQPFSCEKVHFRRLISPHTDTSLGDCSFLDTCRHMKTCKYVHYELDPTPDHHPHLAGPPPHLSHPHPFAHPSAMPFGAPAPHLTPPLPHPPMGMGMGMGMGGGNGPMAGGMMMMPRHHQQQDLMHHHQLLNLQQMQQSNRPEYCSDAELGEPQWVSCDIRTFQMGVLGQFGVIMADPPWDIHMELPYGTMMDDEMRSLNVQALQTDGLIFLWVTGRAMELGRECLELWGYKRVEEIIWLKTNQLQRIIRTGRTGHWLNHSKEHCLVGIKGSPLINRNIDTDVVVAEVRETSRKPDEMYPLLERISPRTRKIELFARMHNTYAGWMSLGNQLDGVRLVDSELRKRFRTAYPDIDVKPTDAELAARMKQMG